MEIKASGWKRSEWESGGKGKSLRTDDVGGATSILAN